MLALGYASTSQIGRTQLRCQSIGGTFVPEQTFDFNFELSHKKTLPNKSKFIIPEQNQTLKKDKKLGLWHNELIDLITR